MTRRLARRVLRALAVSTAFSTVLACAGAEPSSSAAAGVVAPSAEQGANSQEKTAARTLPERLSLEVLQTRPHAADAYTQGLLVRDGIVYESTGRYGQSTVRKWRLEDGVELARHTLDARYFGEGLEWVEGRLIQVTWHAGVAFVYDPADLTPIESHRYDGQGWGLTYDGDRLILSDGTHVLRFLDPETFEELHRIEVRRGRAPQDQLNELELVGGLVYANIFLTDKIVAIDPVSGQVVREIAAGGLLRPSEAARADVLNGIALLDAEEERLLLTGKLWPRSFEVLLEPDSTAP